MTYKEPGPRRALTMGASPPNPPSIPWSALAALGAAVLLFSSPAHADARTEARRHFKTGMQLIQNKQYADGIAELEKANEILPHPNVTYNIARAHAEAGNLEQAVAAYKQYLATD